VDDARAAVHGLRRGEHLVRHRRREDRAGARRVEHSLAHEAAVQRLMARSSAGDERDFAFDRSVPAQH
jgi:hypothetical protein